MLQDEDSNLRKIRSRVKAQKHWDKLRRYVMYTWDCRALEDTSENNVELTGCCTDVIMRPLQGTLSSRRQSSLNGKDTSSSIGKARIPSRTRRETDSKECKASATRSVLITHYDDLPPIPTLELTVGSDTDVAQIQKSIQSLYDHNNILRENLIATQSMLHRLTSKSNFLSEQTHI
uniref:Uncharacterized protein n=1 Tax=Kalanchoe fedtschenkoi TaxID=63787 RepID=A0A7N0VGS3_KALFE